MNQSNWNLAVSGLRKSLGLLVLSEVNSLTMTKSVVEQHRSWCGHQKNSDFPITSSYGGHYFSARQATWIDAFRRTLPKSRVARRVALGALIQASSQCAASPGHTAQPFQPTPTAMRFLHKSWQRNVVEKIRDALIALAATKVKEKGLARKIDANLLAKSLKRGDLVFIDPPYSGVHYSRFYHVLGIYSLGALHEGIWDWTISIGNEASSFSL